MKNRVIFKRFISFLLVFTMILGNLIPFNICISKASSEKEIYKSTNCSIVFKVNSEWDSGFEGQFIIKNLGNETLENWKFQLKFPHEITNLWDGKILSHKGDVYVIQCPDWNLKIPAGGQAVIGFNAKKGKTITAPTNCELLMDRYQVDEEDFEITYRTTSDWGDAFNGEISIKNNTSQSIEGWQLEFDFSKEITNFWTAKILSHEGNHYIIRNDEWNSVIKPNTVIHLGFEGKPGNVNEEPQNYKLTKIQDDENIEVEKPEDTPKFDIEKVNWDKDTDGDGIPDDIEIFFGTDLNKSDTDGDGLDDMYELETSETDFNKTDTDGNGITDDKEDFDKDGLTTIEEFEMKTDPYVADTDDDGLSDGDEVKKFKTNPLVQDTDNDGLLDGDEIKIGLDPLKKMTHEGIPDKDYQMEQKITEDKFFVNQDKKEFQISMDITASGCVETGMGVADSSSQNLLSSNRAILGDAIDFNYVEGTMSSATLKFRINEKYIKEANAGGTNIDNELKGLKRFNIFRLNQEDDKENASLLLPIETNFDSSTNTISAKVDELGTYCVVDMNMWLYDLGIRSDNVKEKQTFDLDDENEANTDDVPSPDYKPITEDELKQSIEDLVNYSQTPEKTKKKVNQQVDLTIVMDVSHSMDKTINQIKAYIGTLVERLYQHNITLHTSLVKFTEYKKGQENNTKVLKTKDGSIWAKNSIQAVELLSKLEIASGKEETPIDGIGMGMELDYRKGAEKYMVLLTDEGCNPVNRYGIKDLNETAKLLKEKDITTCVVTKEKLEKTYSMLSDKTGGKYFDINSNFVTGIEELILNNLKGEDGFFAVSGLTLEPISLKKKLAKGGSYDTDGDGLTDSQEVNWNLVKKTSPVEFYTLGEYLEKSEKSYFKNALNRFSMGQQTKVLGISLLPEKTKIKAKDSDGDGVPDKDDPRPLKYDVSSINLFNSKKKKIKDQNGKIPLDMTCGDFSKKQLLKFHPYFEYQAQSSVNDNKKDFSSLLNTLSNGNLYAVAQKIIEHFMNGTGNDFKNKTLTKAFKDHDNTEEFIKRSLERLKKQLKKNNYELSTLSYKKGNEYDRFIQDGVYPKFTKFDDNFNGMGILIHDIWSCNILVKNYKVTKKKYSGTIQYTFYDHFGLDQYDMEKKFVVALAGFRAWFTLQHYKKYNKKYKPFVTVFKFDVKFEGNIHG